MRRRSFVSAGLASSLLSAQPPPRSDWKPAQRDWIRRPKVANKIADVCQPVPFGAQRLDPASYLGRRFDINFTTGLLRTIDLDDYLRGYGKKPNMPPGEYLGKFMQGLSRMYLITGDSTARDRLDLIVRTWLKVQSDDGWLGSYQRFKSWDIWEHKYVLLGLIDYYSLTGEEPALASARKVGDLILANLGPKLGNILQSGHWALGSASILEPMVYLYRYTAEPKYLRFCEYILETLEGPTGPKLIRTLTTGSRRVCDVEDTWANRAAREIRFKDAGQIRNRSKGYEMLSCIIGIARMYQLTGQPEYREVAVNAWKDIAENRLYLAGSSGADECFKDDHCLPAESMDGPAEACVTAHWIFLSRVLFEISGEPRYADAVENALYNYLLASQRPQDCHQSYNTPMNGTKSLERHTIWGGKPPCCISSTMREIARTPEAVWTRFADNGVGVLLYSQAEMQDTIRTPRGPLAVRLAMETSYPATGNATIRVWPERNRAFRLALRVPAWSKKFVARVGGREFVGTPGQFLNLEREWRPNDTVTVSMDLHERLISGGASYPGHFAFMRGPQVLTLVHSGGPQAKLPVVKVSSKSGSQLVSSAEILPNGWVGKQAYRTPALEGAEGCLLVPFGDSSQPLVSREFRTWVPAQPGTGPAVPEAPADLQATALGPDRIRISWKHQGPAQGFRLERKRTDVDLWFHVKSTAAGVTTCEDGSVNVTLPGKTYIYRVSAFSDGGMSPYSPEATVATPALMAPAGPSDFQAAAFSSTQINLSWTSRSDNEEGFQVERRDGESGEWRPLAGRIPAKVTVFHDFALEPGARYDYRIRAFNAGGPSAWSDTIGASTPARNQR